MPLSSDAVQQVRRACVQKLFSFNPELKQQEASARSNVNIALVKYWGKRDSTLNLPVTSSLSVELPEKGTRTLVRFDGRLQSDQVVLNGEPVSRSSSFYQRTVRHLDLFRQQDDHFYIESHNSIPTAAGLASSASGFAALTEAMIALYGLARTDEKASIVARLGSGSACRSILPGFVKWNAGERDDGIDSFAEVVPATWPELCVALLMVESGPKAMGSTQGMLLTQNTALQYQVWPEQVSRDMALVEKAILARDFASFGSVSESNALCMHASMLCSRPPLLYWQPESVEHMHRVWFMRQQGVEVYFTMDAGPNLKLLFLKKDIEVIKSHFAGVDIIEPFSACLKQAQEYTQRISSSG